MQSVNACLSCGSPEVNPQTFLCDECSEDMGVDDEYEEFNDESHS